MKTLSFFENIVFKHHSIFYLIGAIGLTFAIRFVLSLFKARAINDGEIDDPQNKEETKWKGKGFCKALKYSFCSNAKDIRIDDYWLPALIGLSELLVFPFLMVKDLWVFIGAWLGIKTASSWRGWEKTRTAYNRFLLGNILSLGASYLLALIFFKL